MTENHRLIPCPPTKFGPTPAQPKLAPRMQFSMAKADGRRKDTAVVPPPVRWPGVTGRSAQRWQSGPATIPPPAVHWPGAFIQRASFRRGFIQRMSEGEDPPEKSWANPSNPWKQRAIWESLSTRSNPANEKEKETTQEADKEWTPYGRASHGDVDSEMVLFFLQANRTALDTLYEGPSNWGEWIKTELYLRTKDPGLAQTEVLAESKANRQRFDRYVAFVKNQIDEGELQRMFVITRYVLVGGGLEVVGVVTVTTNSFGSRSHGATYTVLEYPPPAKKS